MLGTCRAASRDSDRVHHGAPATTFGAANFGTITTALDPRVVQFAVKFWF